MIQFLITAVIILLVQAPTKTFQARITVNGTYKPGYSNSDSAEFKTFATHFCQRVGEYLNKKLAGYRGCEVKKLTSGSIKAEAIIIFADSSPVTQAALIAQFNNSMHWDTLSLEELA